MSKKIKVILCVSSRQLGKVGDVLSVKRGYFTNFLQPNKYASIYSEQVADEIAKKQLKVCEDLDVKRKEADKILSYIDKTHLSFLCNASGTGVLYGSIEKIQIKNELEKILNYQVKDIEISQKIKTIGIHKVIVDIFEDKHATLNILVGKTDADIKLLENEIKKGAK